MQVDPASSCPAGSIDGPRWTFHHLIAMGKKSKKKGAGAANTSVAKAAINKCKSCEKIDDLSPEATVLLSLCTCCRLVSYCSKACQTADWPHHRDFCKQAKDEAQKHLGEIWTASKYDQARQLKKLLRKYPAAVNLHRADQGTWLASNPLQIASAMGKLESVKILLEAGASVSIGDKAYNQLPIHRAAEFGDVEIVKLLLEHGSEIVVGDNMGQHPLHYAAEFGRFDKFLLENGASPSLTVAYRGKTPKVWAQLNGHEKCAKLL